MERIIFLGRVIFLGRIIFLGENYRPVSYVNKEEKSNPHNIYAIRENDSFNEETPGRILIIQ